MCGVELMPLPDGVQRVATVLQAHAHPHAPVMMNDAARTAQQAADALGIDLGQIAKSIIFRRKSDDVAVLVVTSGDRRVDEKKVAALVGPLGRADAAFVKARTGFSIGGVAPLAHALPPVTLIDQELFRFDTIWAAAGHPNSMFQLSPLQLARMADAPVADVAQALAVAPAINAPELIAARAIETRASVENAPSSCSSVCRTSEDTSSCESCYRRPLANATQAAAAAPAVTAPELIAARAIVVRATTENVPSPCISVCRMSEDTGWCEGCYRTLDEIRQWSQSDDAAKHALWREIEQRLTLKPA